jgi:orotate phosphoribosyltransferase
MSAPPPGLAGIVSTGHFVYESGEHGDTWLELDALLLEPEPMRRIAVGLAARLEPWKLDVVCGPETGGARLAVRVADGLGILGVPIERGRAPDGRPAYSIAAGHHAGLRNARVALVDDAINAGFATGASLEALTESGAHVTVVGAAILRKAARPALERRFGCRIEALHELNFETWPAGECPLCARGVPITRRA